MAGQVSPGIVIRERDLTNQVVVNSIANTAALVGTFERGPIGVITNITSERQLVEIFGKPNSNNFEDWFVGATFLSYGGQLLVVRIDDSNLTNAVSEFDSEEDTAPTIKSLQDFENNFASYNFKFAARTPGSWGNSIKIAWVDGSLTSSQYNTATYATNSEWSSIVSKPASENDIHILVIDEGGTISGVPGTILESYFFISKLEDGVNSEGETNYYINLINRRSKYVYASSLVTGANSSLSLDGGQDSYNADLSNYQDAFSLFDSTESVNIDYILAGGSITYGSTPGDSTKTKALTAINIANTRKDCIAFVSPYRNFVSFSSSSDQKQAILDYFSLLPSTSYAVYDSGYKYIYDRYNDTYRFIPCCGDVAGLCVQTSINSEDWFSPAGLNRGNLRNAIKLAYTPSKEDRDQLYINRINPITAFPGQGIVLFGDKTALATPSAFDRINVRRLFLALQRRVGQVAKNVLFELNDETTRSTFFGTINSYMGEVQAKRGVTDYLVVCDETNNTPDVIDRNEFVAEIYVKPSRSINYITITFVATRTGVSFSEVVGRV
jgi:hypothetical protein